MGFKSVLWVVCHLRLIPYYDSRVIFQVETLTHSSFINKFDKFRIQTLMKPSHRPHLPSFSSGVPLQRWFLTWISRMIPYIRHKPRCVLENTAQYPVLVNITAVFIIIVTVMLPCYENVKISIDGARLELCPRSRSRDLWGYINQSFVT